MPSVPVNICPECDYDQRGHPPTHRCPECGLCFDERSELWRPPRTTWPILGAILLFLATAQRVWQIYESWKHAHPLDADDVVLAALFGIFFVIVLQLEPMAMNRRYVFIGPDGVRARSKRATTTIPWSRLSDGGRIRGVQCVHLDGSFDKFRDAVVGAASDDELLPLMDAIHAQRAARISALSDKPA